MKISIVVPIYNVEKYLNRCLDSIEEQTFKDYELLLIDDGSTDESGRIADEYAKKDDRIIVVHKSNGGLSEARNYGIDKAQGEYICFIDSDDWIEPTYLEELLGIAISRSADIVICEYIKSDGDTIISQPEVESLVEESGKEAIDNLYGRYYGEYVVAWNKLYKRVLFEKLRYPVGLIHEDEAVCAEYYCMAAKVVRTNRILYNYRVNNSASIMKSEYTLKRLDIIRALEMRMDTLKREGLTDYYEKDSFKYLYKILLNCIEVKKLPNNKRLLKELKKKYWIKYRETMSFNWTLKRKAGMMFFGIFPRAYLLRYKKTA